MKAISLATSCAIATLFFCCLNQLQAQTDGGTSTSSQVKYCDLALPTLEKKLQTEADATCTTQSGCIECMDRTSKMILAATLVVQPKMAECKTVTDIEVQPDPKSRGIAAIDDPVSTFQPKIIQSPCFAGGTNLEVYVPGHDIDNREFAFLWEVDGHKAGHLPTVQCACGKIATVRVTYLPTAQAVTLRMKLNSACGSGTGSDK
ncbi:MAG: hypothetical protein GC192_20090 [Bacteroidetes bacterium]|nr:hypothetical protein [Bacteroidota bacterium]